MFFKKNISFRKSIFTKTAITFTLFITLFSFLVSQLLWNEFTGSHFLFLNILPLINIFSTLILFYFVNYNLNKNFKLISLFILTIFSFFFVGKTVHKTNNQFKYFSGKYDSKFITEIKSYLDSSSKKGVIIEDLSIYSNPKTESAIFNPYVFSSGHFIFGLSRGVQLSSLNYNEINNASSEVNWIKNFYFNDSYVNYLKKNKYELSSRNNKHRMSYIRENKINYVLLGPGTELDTIFESLVYKKIINTIDDSKLYILKQ